MALRMNEHKHKIVIFIFCAFFWLTLHIINPTHRKISTDETISMKELLAASIYLAEAGGIELVKIHSKGAAAMKTAEKTGKSDLVTAGDHASHDIMYHGMKNAFPQLMVISEEGQDQRDPPSSIGNVKLVNSRLNRILVSDELIPIEDITIWIDPLDATKEYTEGLTQYVTTMVGIAVDGEAVAGVIHYPFEGETIWGWVEHGNNILDQSEKSPLNSIIMSRSHTGKAEDQTKTMVKDAKIVKAGGAGYKAMGLFHGLAEVYFHSGIIKKWDLCAAEGIVKSTCYGRFTALDGSTIDYSARSNHVNSGGVLASLHHHEKYLGKYRTLTHEL